MSPEDELRLVTRRVRALERTVDGMALELAALRAELTRRDLAAHAIPTRTPPVPHPPAARAAPAPAGAAQRPGPSAERRVPRPRPAFPSGADIETLVGRFGILALGTLTLLAALGTFLGWAMREGLLGPELRVGLGLLLAAALGVAGARLRRRERSWGATLLGLALAATHVCAWAAGPALGLVAQPVAFALAALASGALALFAHRESDEPLWCVGFGGAAVAPFVTSSAPGSAWMLAAWGALVLVAGGWALGGRAWRIAGRVFLVSASLYVTALLAQPDAEGGPLMSAALPFVAMLAGVLPRADRAVVRTWLRGLGALAAVAALGVALSHGHPIARAWVAVGLGALGLLWLALVDHAAELPASEAPHAFLRGLPTVAEWLDGAGIPLAFAFGVVAQVDGSQRTTAALLALASLAPLALAVRRPRGVLRDAAAFATAVLLVVAIFVQWQGSGLEGVAALATCVVAFTVAHRRWPSGSWTWMGALAMAIAMAGAWTMLAERTRYAYTPFATRASAAALVVAIALVAVARLTGALPGALSHGREGAAGAAPAKGREAMLVLAIVAGAWPWLWVHQELAWAFGPTAATLLLVTYYAASSVAAVGFGRARGIAALRHLGLALGLLAAWTALRGARGLDDPWARIAGYLVVSVFLLGIAYWYRRPGSDAVDEPRPAPRPTPPETSLAP
jgi:hypothetical protein